MLFLKVFIWLNYLKIVWSKLFVNWDKSWINKMNSKTYHVVEYSLHFLIISYKNKTNPLAINICFHVLCFSFFWRNVLFVVNKTGQLFEFELTERKTFFKIIRETMRFFRREILFFFKKWNWRNKKSHLNFFSSS